MSTHMLIAVLLLILLDPRPPLSDLARFPSIDVVEYELKCNRLYHDYILSRRAVEHRHWWVMHEVVVETNQLHTAWDTLWRAQLHGHSHIGRGNKQRDGLARLRELLGPERYYAGEMPPAIPIHRFNQINR